MQLQPYTVDLDVGPDGPHTMLPPNAPARNAALRPVQARDSTGRLGVGTLLMSLAFKVLGHIAPEIGKSELSKRLRHRTESVSDACVCMLLSFPPCSGCIDLCLLWYMLESGGESLLGQRHWLPSSPLA